jgi:hypothetical protein
VLRYAGAPKVEVLAGQVSSSWDAARGDLSLAYTHGPGARAHLRRRPCAAAPAAGRREASMRFWTQDTAAGRVLQLSPALVRTASLDGGKLALTGDTDEDSTLEIWGPAFSR